MSPLGGMCPLSHSCDPLCYPLGEPFGKAGDELEPLSMRRGLLGLYVNPPLFSKDGASIN